MKYREIGEHLVVDPQVCFGRLTFKGTRLPVEAALACLAKYGTVEAVLENFPGLTRESLEEAIRLASSALIKVSRASPWRGNGASAKREHRTVPRKPAKYRVAR